MPAPESIKWRFGEDNRWVQSLAAINP